jgi:uncharacterized protein (UPF0335 family)
MFRSLFPGCILTLALALPCAAQTQDTSATKPATTDTPQTAPAKPKPKKVWTNDELKSVSGGVSVVGDANATGTESETKDAGKGSAGKDLHQKQIENYRSQIERLRGQIDAADKRIAQLKNFKGENAAPSGGINPNQGYNMVPVEEQVKQLEDKKKQLQGKIDDVENEARKNGIDPGDLR